MQSPAAWDFGEELQQLPPWRPGAAQSRRRNLGLAGWRPVWGEELDADLGGNADFGLNIMLELGRFESQSTSLFFFKVASCR